MSRFYHPSKAQVQAFFKTHGVAGVVRELKLTEHDVQILQEYLADDENGPVMLPIKLARDIEGHMHFVDPPQLDLSKGHPCCRGSS